MKSNLIVFAVILNSGIASAASLTWTCNGRAFNDAGAPFPQWSNIVATAEVLDTASVQDYFAAEQNAKDQVLAQCGNQKCKLDGCTAPNGDNISY